MSDLLTKLSGGDLRSEGRAGEVAIEVIGNPDLLVTLVKGLHVEDKVTRARTCMVMEIISRENGDLLVEVVPQLIELASVDKVSQARWHLAEIFGNVSMSARQVEGVIPVLFDYLGDKSKIVRYCAVQALGVLGRESPMVDEIVRRILGMELETKSLRRAATEALSELGVEE